MKQCNTLILGLGNDLLSDDGIGPKLIQNLRSHFDQEIISFKTSPVGGLELIDILKGYQKVIVIDAIKTGSNTPGTVLHLTPANYRDLWLRVQHAPQSHPHQAKSTIFASSRLLICILVLKLKKVLSSILTTKRISVVFD